MKIVHIAAQAPYNDNWGYQENLLLKYQCKLGHNVTLFVTNKKHEDGRIIEIPENEYCLDDGEKIIRKAHKIFTIRKLTGIFSYMPIYDYLCKIQPDFIFVHGLGNVTSIAAAAYKVFHNRKCLIVADNHSDNNNSGKRNNFSIMLVKLFYRFYNKCFMQFFYKKVYGVSPLRKEYAEKVFGISKKKTDVLLMGADDEKLEILNKDNIRSAIRKKYGIKDDVFLVISGGKIDKNKKIELLLDAAIRLPKVVFLIFGSLDDEMTNILNKYRMDNNIIFIGWINADEVYKYFLASELVVFPGGHSVLWEQAVASGVPCVFKYYKGMTHIDIGGNCLFLYKDNSNEIYNIIKEISENKTIYDEVKAYSSSDARRKFLYSEIAKKSLECLTARGNNA